MPAAHGFTNDGQFHEVIEPLWIQGLGTVRQGFSGIGEPQSSESVPAAIAAIAIAGTYSALPVPWLGSIIIGKWVSDRNTGITDKSSVLRA